MYATNRLFLENIVQVGLNVCNKQTVPREYSSGRAVPNKRAVPRKYISGSLNACNTHTGPREYSSGRAECMQQSYWA